MNTTGLSNFKDTLQYYRNETTSKNVSKKIGIILDNIRNNPVTVEDVVTYISTVPKFIDLDEGDEFGEYIENATINANDPNFHHAVSHALLGKNSKEAIFEPRLERIPVITPGELLSIKNYFSINAFYNKDDELDEDGMMVFAEHFIDYAEIGIDVKSYVSDKISSRIFSKAIYSFYMILKEIDWSYPDQNDIPYFRFMKNLGGRFSMPMIGYAEILHDLVDAQILALSTIEQAKINHDLLQSYVEKFLVGFESYLSDLKTGYFERRIKKYGGIVPYFRSS